MPPSTPRRPSRIRIDVRIAPAALDRIDAITTELTTAGIDGADRSTVLRELLALGLDAWDTGKRRSLPRTTRR